VINSSFDVNLSTGLANSVRAGVRPRNFSDATNRAGMRLTIIAASVAIVGLAIGFVAWRFLRDDPYRHLTALRNATDSQDREAAVNQVVKHASQLDPKLALRTLGAVTRDSSPQVRVAAVCAIGSFIPNADPAIPDLCYLVKADQDEVVRVAALDTLGLIIGPRAKPYDAVLDVFLDSLKDKCELVRLRASAALSRSDRAEEVVSTLVELIDSKDHFVRWQALRGLGRIGPRASSAVRPVEKALSDQSARIRVEAVLALVRMGFTSSVKPALGDALHSRNPLVRAIAIEAFQRMQQAGESD
jgi:HEAT repeat protein